MRVFWSCIFSLYTGLFFNTIINLWNWYLNCPTSRIRKEVLDWEAGIINYKFSFSFTLLCGLMIAICWYLSSIVHELKMQRLSGFLKDRYEEQSSEMIGYAGVWIILSIVVGFFITIIWRPFISNNPTYEIVYLFSFWIGFFVIVRPKAIKMRDKYEDWKCKIKQTKKKKEN